MISQIDSVEFSLLSANSPVFALTWPSTHTDMCHMFSASHTIFDPYITQYRPTAPDSACELE